MQEQQEIVAARQALSDILTGKVSEYGNRIDIGNEPKVVLMMWVNKPIGEFTAGLLHRALKRAQIPRTAEEKVIAKKGYISYGTDFGVEEFIIARPAFNRLCEAMRAQGQ